MSDDQIFETSPAGAGAKWLIALALASGGAVLGWKLGCLQHACLAAIAMLVLLQGVVPFFSVARLLVMDAAGTKEEVEVMRDVEIHHSQELLDSIGDDAYSGMRMFEAEARSVDRMNKGDAAHGYVDGLVTELREASSAIELAGELCPAAGLGGSLLGLGTALPGLSTLIQPTNSAGGGVEIANVFSSFATVTSTTLAGCVGAAICMGLHSILENAISKHESDLRLVANALMRGQIDLQSPDEPTSDDTYNLFAENKT